MGTYYFSAFKCPISILDKLRSIITKFWWLGAGKQKGVYWKCWEQLIKPKQEGGLGIKDDPKTFNRALLANQGWKIINKPDSQLAQIMSDKYKINVENLFEDNWKKKARDLGWERLEMGSGADSGRQFLECRRWIESKVWSPSDSRE